MRNNAIIATFLCAITASSAWAQQAPAPAGPPATMQPLGLGYGAAPPPVAPNTIDDPSFNQALQSQMPLTPEQITTANRLKSEVERALATPGGQPAAPDSKTINVSLDPGAPSPVVHLQEGDITTLVFQDATGAPWPVTGIFIAPEAGVAATILGNDLVQDANKSNNAGSSTQATPNLVGILQPDQTATSAGSGGNSGEAQALAADSSNIVALDPTTSEIVGKNMVVTLQGLAEPLVFTFDAGGSVVDYRTAVIIAGNGPNAVIEPDHPDMPSIEMSGIQSFVDGVPPSGATKLDVSDPAIEAWLYNGKMFVRTEDTMASASDYSRTSPSGQSVYVLTPMPIFDVFYNGALEQVTVNSLPPAYDYSSASSPADSDASTPADQEQNQ